MKNAIAGLIKMRGSSEPFQQPGEGSPAKSVHGSSTFPVLMCRLKPMPASAKSLQRSRSAYATLPLTWGRLGAAQLLASRMHIPPHASYALLLWVYTNLTSRGLHFNSAAMSQGMQKG